MAIPVQESTMNIPISVLMAAGGNTDISAEAVKSLKRHAVMNYQLVFIDNGSDPEEKLAETIRPLLGNKDVFIRNEVGRSFARANNQALAVADGIGILCLNNDIVAEGDWQTPFVTEGVKYTLSGPCFRRLTTDHELKIMLCKREHGKMAEANPDDVAAYLEGWCMFIRKDAFQSIGGFDEVFWPMYCEDADLSFRVKAMGGTLGRVECPIRHLGQQDSTRYLKNQYKDVLATANCHRLYARWVKGALL